MAENKESNEKQDQMVKAKDEKEEKVMSKAKDEKEVEKAKDEDKKDDKEVEKAKTEDDEDLSEMSEDEKKAYKALKGKVKPKLVKSEGSSLSPAEAGAKGASDSNTISSGASVPSKPQDVFVPQSSIHVSGEQKTPMGKSINDSPVFVNLTKQLDSMQAVLSTKVEALEKSVNDRMSNIKKDMEKIEKFYSGSFYKATSEGVGPEGKTVQAENFSKQISDGKVRYSN